MPSATKKKVSPRPSGELKTRLREHPMLIEWSDEDQVYLASFPSLRGCVTHGKTPESAFRNGLDALETYFLDAKPTARRRQRSSSGR